MSGAVHEAAHDSDCGMRLDVIIATHNRAPLLGRTIESFARARVPNGMQVTIVVVDNNSTDDTRDLVASLAPSFGDRMRYLFEGQTGKSHALNAGLAVATGEFVGMVDDDEEIDASWFEEIARAFADPTLDFITGPYVPRWEVPPPSWLPQRPSSVVGWVDGGPTVRTFGEDFDGVLMGGNAVVRLALLRAVGGYDPELGPTASRRLGSCEDEDVQRRLMAAGARGQYRPDLIIHHFIPATRLTRTYHRRWFFEHGLSKGLLARGTPETIPHLLGVPRYRVGRVARALVWTVPGLVGVGPFRAATARFDARMDAIDLAGFWYGKFRYRQRASAPAPALVSAAS